MSQPESRRDFWTGFLLAALGTGLFAIKSILIKLAYAAGSNPEAVLLLRMLIAAPIYLLIGIITWSRSPTLRQNSTVTALLQISLLGFLGYYLASLLDLKGLALISAQLERLMLFTYPIMVAILGALFFKQPFNRKILLALVSAYCGIVLIYHHESTLGGDEVLLGTLLVGLSALSFSLYVLFSRSRIKQFGSVWFTSVAMLASSVYVVLHFSLLYDFSSLLISPEILLWVGLLAIFSTVIPSFMIAEAISRIGPAQTGIIGMLGPVFTIGLAVAILGEPFTLQHLLGFGLVMLGVSVLTVRGK